MEARRTFLTDCDLEHHQRRWITSFTRILTHPFRLAHGYSEPVRHTKNNDPNYFRWFDTGDIQGIEMLHAINQIALRTPEVAHWLPTKEFSIVREALQQAGWTWAPNLTIRISILMRDAQPSKEWLDWALEADNQGLRLTFSQVFTPELDPAPGFFECIALKQEHECRECRMCWTEELVAYPWRER